MGILKKLFGKNKNDYKGDLKEGLPNGTGTMNFASGNVYKGSWKNGKMMGFEENLSDKDIDSVLAYIKSYWPKDKYEHQIGISK